MKYILAYKNKLLDESFDEPMLVQGIVPFEGEQFNNPNPQPWITYITVADDVEVNYQYVVTKLEDGSYKFTKP